MLVGLENNTHNDTIPFYLSSNYQTLQLMLQYRPVSYEMLHTVSRLHFKQQAHIYASCSKAVLANFNHRRAA